MPKNRDTQPNCVGNRRFNEKVVHNSSTWPSGLLQVAWVQRFEVFRDEHVLADQFVVEPHLAPTVLGSLISTMSQWTADRLPLSHSSYAWPGVKCSEPAIFSSNKISPIGSQMCGLKPSETADVARAVVGIKNLVDAFCVACGGIDDFAILELETHVFKPCPGVDGRCVVLDHAVDRFHRAGKDFAVRDVGSPAQ